MSEAARPKPAEKPCQPEEGGSRRSKALQALLAEPTVARAAVVSGVPERTLRRWVGQPAFRSAWLRLRRESFGQAIGLGVEARTLMAAWWPQPAEAVAEELGRYGHLTPAEEPAAEYAGLLGQTWDGRFGGT